MKRISLFAFFVVAIILCSAVYGNWGGPEPTKNMGFFRSFSFYPDVSGSAAQLWLTPGNGPSSHDLGELWFDSSGDLNIYGGGIFSGDLNVPKLTLPVTAITTPALDATIGLTAQVSSVTIVNNCTIDLSTTNSTWPTTGNKAVKELWITNGGAATVTWNGVTWATSAPILSTSGTDYLYFVSIDGGTTVIGSQLRDTASQIDCHANCSPTAFQLSNSVITNYGQEASDITITGPTLTSGVVFCMDVGTAQAANFWKYTSTTNNIYLDANASPYTSIQFAAPAVGNSICCHSFKTGASTYSLRCTTNAGTSTGS